MSNGNSVKSTGDWECDGCGKTRPGVEDKAPKTPCPDCGSSPSEHSYFEYEDDWDDDWDDDADEDED